MKYDLFNLGKVERVIVTGAGGLGAACKIGPESVARGVSLSDEVFGALSQHSPIVVAKPAGAFDLLKKRVGDKLLYDVYNPTRTPRVFHDGIAGSQRKLRLDPGGRLVKVELGDTTVQEILDDPRLELTEHFVEGEWEPLQILPVADQPDKPPVIIEGMWGIGDNLHQRAAIRELMKTHNVWLKTCHLLLYHDLVARGLKLIFKSTRLRAQARTIAREASRFPAFEPPPADAPVVRISYQKPLIDAHGSILGAMMAECGVGSALPDFSLPIPEGWRDQARAMIAQWGVGDRPLMLHRPIVQRREWDGSSRNPDPGAYAAIFAEARKGFFVASIADLSPGQEWIVGPEADADVKIYDGSLDFETLAALFAEAKIGFFNAGFAPVLAQAVGLPSIVVYGGRESFATTQAAGAHLAPTLGIDPIKPCDCHSSRHNCDKRVAVLAAFDRVRPFVEKYRAARVLDAPVGPEVPETPRAEGNAGRRAATLIFATTYVDSQDRVRLTDQWLRLTMALNPDCDILLVDSASPFRPFIDEAKYGKFEPYEPGKTGRRMIFDFGDNVGHLSRKGRDGWGRAFCKGLDIAAAEGYEFVAHIEGDSLFKLPLTPIVAQMRREKTSCASIPVRGMKRDFPSWVETGLMVFSTAYLRHSGFTTKYDWPNRKENPTPEIIVKNILGGALRMMRWNGLRGDKAQITHENVLSLKLDWVTHCHGDIWVYDRFIESILGPPKVDKPLIKEAPAAAPPTGVSRETSGRVAIVLGGGKDVEAELAEARELCAASGVSPQFFVINDWIGRFLGDAIGITLHPSGVDKLQKWLGERAAAGRPPLAHVWAHRKADGVTDATEDWAGSSGLFAVKVARQLGFERIILCGVPMLAEAEHFVRGVRWNSASTFQRGWVTHKAEIAPFTRSMSGWTADLFGRPDVAFLT